MNTGTCGAGRRRSRMRGGMGYGFDGSTIGTAGAVYGNSWGGEITQSGAPVTNMDDPMRGSSRRRRRVGGLEIDEIAKKSGKPAEAEEKPKKRVIPEPSAPPPDDEPQRGGRRRKSKKANRRKTGRKTRRRGGVDGSAAAGNSGPGTQSGFPPMSLERMRSTYNFGRANPDAAPIVPAVVPTPGMTGPAAVGAPQAPGTLRRGGKGHRKSKKAGRRNRRKLYGGMSVAHSSAGFTGTGERGLANYQDVGGSQPFSNNVVPLS